ncbi:hypothetical protein HY251_04660 [bacterium]|nr:hypothetical protein [bacterium]
MPEKKNRTLLWLALASGVFLAVLSFVVLRARNQEPLVLRVEPGETPRRLRLSLVNAGDAPRTIYFSNGEEAGDEFSVEARDERGELVSPIENSPGDATPVSSHSLTVTLSPRESRSLSLDLDRFVRLPGPGRYTVTVRRALLMKGETRLRSNDLALEIR